MAMVASRRGRKRLAWAGEGVLDLTANPGAAEGLLTMAECARRVGLTESTLYDLATRRPVTNPQAPEFALSRPYAHIGTTPYYSPAQCDRYDELKAAAGARNANPDGPPLPVLDPEDAAEQGLVTPVALSEEFGHALETWGRWATWYVDFPPAVAELKRPGVRGRRPRLRRMAEVAAWLERNRDLAGDGK